jgi:hypothetical protein
MIRIWIDIKMETSDPDPHQNGVDPQHWFTYVPYQVVSSIHYPGVNICEIL